MTVNRFTTFSKKNLKQNLRNLMNQVGDETHTVYFIIFNKEYSLHNLY
jgi:hypothetical protein